MAVAAEVSAEAATVAVRAAAAEAEAVVLQLALVVAAADLVAEVVVEWEGAVVVTAAAALERVLAMQA